MVIEGQCKQPLASNLAVSRTEMGGYLEFLSSMAYATRAFQRQYKHIGPRVV